VKSSLYGAIGRCGEGPQLGSLFIDLFAWDIDFFQDVRPGDEFRVMVEKVAVDGTFLQYGRVLAAEYKGKFGQHRIVHYTPPNGEPGYYTDTGRAVRKEFLKSPLKYTKVASQQSQAKRKGLKRSSAAVYTANVGTPVWAVAAGKVIFAGTSGSLGKTVTIKHDNGFTSTYGHLARIPSDIQVGAELGQKHVIGTVGQSGSATEPKLLFSLRKNGKLVNPMRLKFSESGPVSDDMRGHFDQHTKEVLKDLEAIPVVSTQERRS
jgi:murein DD-endopeptidase MepM/ murein hydrolase activator NlpD